MLFLYKKLKLFKNQFYIITLLFIFVISLLIFPHNTYSKTLDDIERELEEKEKALENLESELTNAQNAANYFKSQKSNSSSTLEQVKYELEEIQSEMETNDLELEKVKSTLELLELELEKNKMIMDDKLIDLYIYNRQGAVDIMLENGEIDGFWKSFKYREKILDIDIEGLNELGEDIDNIHSDKQALEASMTVLDDEQERLSSRKTELEQQVNYYAAMEVYNTERQSGIRAQMGTVQQDLSNLSAEQQRMLEEEARIIAGANGGTKPLESGEFYFYGRGRYIYQGHGLGFSQYGAMGGAQHGMSAQSIASFYYQGSYIGNSSGSVNVVGYGSMNIEDYVSGLGEIPDKACGTQEQVNERSDKYALDNPGSIWDCWPEESIKAQVIVARSYALAYGGPICTDARCQVYKGGEGKRWAANETSGEVLMSGGSIIKAFYSSDNNNGWGTATHKKPVWCTEFHGNCGNGYSWLQGVNDSSFAAKGPYTDWIWRTNSYTMEELAGMLSWYSEQSFTFPYSSDVANLKNNVGDLQDVDLEKDVSGRVAKIWLAGSAGRESINGDFFKSIFIFWVYNVKPSGEVDPIFSLTYNFSKVP